MKPAILPSTFTGWINRTLIGAVILTVIFTGGNAPAQTATWIGTTSATWSDGTNWNGGTGTAGAPASGEALEFGASTPTALTDDLMTPSTYTVAGITFDSTAPAFTIAPGTTGTNGFTLIDGITNNSTKTQTISDAIALSGASVTFAMNTGTISLSSVTDAAGAELITSGTGQLTLSTNGAMTAFDAGGIVIGSGSTLAAGTNGNNYTGNLTVDGTFKDNGSSTTKLTGVLSGSGLINVASSTNSLSISGVNNTYTGNLEITANEGITLSGVLNTANSNTYTGNLILTGNNGSSSFIVTSSATQTFSGTISGSGVHASVFKEDGSGETILTGTNTYVSTTSVVLGTLQIGNGSSGSIDDSAATITGGTLAFDEATGSTYSQAITATAGRVEGNEDSLITNTLSGAISGGAQFVQNGAGTTVLSGANTYSGNTAVLTGTLLANTTTGTGSATGSGAVTVYAGTLGGSGNITPTGTATIAINGTGVLAPGSGTDATTNLSINSAAGGLTPSTATSVVALATGAQLTFNLGAANTANQLNVNGGVSYYGGSSSLNFGNTVNFTDLTSGNLSTGLYLLITETGETGLTFGALDGNTGDYLITGGLLSGSMTIDGLTAQLEASDTTNAASIYLDLTGAAVPEPSTWALLILSAVSLVFVARRNGKSILAQRSALR